MPALPAWLQTLIIYVLDRLSGRERDLGRKDADDAANAELEKRIEAALAARNAPDPYADGSVRDPDRRD